MYFVTIEANAIPKLLLCTLKTYWTIRRGQCKGLWESVHQPGIWAHRGGLECRRRTYGVHSSGVNESVTVLRGEILNGMYVCSDGRFLLL